MELDKTRLTKCPLCRGDLYAYSMMGMDHTESCYCPKCDIVRLYLMSAPFLCNKCYSRSFYEINGRQYCWFCDNDKMVGMKDDEIKEKKVFSSEGYKISETFQKVKNNDCKHKNVKNIRHNKDKFKFICEDCGRIEFVWIPEWMQEKSAIKDHIL